MTSHKNYERNVKEEGNEPQLLLVFSHYINIYHIKYDGDYTLAVYYLVSHQLHSYFPLPQMTHDFFN